VVNPVAIWVTDAYILGLPRVKTRAPTTAMIVLIMIHHFFFSRAFIKYIISILIVII
jgi:hypothetical protein